MTLLALLLVTVNTGLAIFLAHIIECSILIDPEKNDFEAVFEALEKTSSFKKSDMEALENRGKALAQSRYSKQRAVDIYRQIIKQHLLTNE